MSSCVPSPRESSTLCKESQIESAIGQARDQQQHEQSRRQRDEAEAALGAGKAPTLVGSPCRGGVGASQRALPHPRWLTMSITSSAASAMACLGVLLPWRACCTWVPIAWVICV